MFCTLNYAQTPEAKTYKYCEIIGFNKAFSTKMNVRIDFGQATKLFEDKRMRDPKTNDLIVFNSMIDALNFMAKDEWKFIQAYVTVDGVNTVSSEVHWVLQKEND